MPPGLDRGACLPGMLAFTLHDGCALCIVTLEFEQEPFVGAILLYLHTKVRNSYTTTAHATRNTIRATAGRYTAEHMKASRGTAALASELPCATLCVKHLPTRASDHLQQQLISAVRVCARVCVCACVRACAHACVRTCV